MDDVEPKPAGFVGQHGGFEMRTANGETIGGSHGILIVGPPKFDPPLPRTKPVVRVDPDGRPYGWSYSCAECGLVYVREECTDPDTDHAFEVMRLHADVEHPGWDHQHS